MTDQISTVGELVGDYVREQCNVLVAAETGLRAGENVIHPTRVAVRRLRSCLRVFAELFDPAAAAHLEQELVWWASVLGEVRDLDILSARLARMLRELPAELVLGPVQSQVQVEISSRRKTAADALLVALDSPRYRELVQTLQQWQEHPPLLPAADAPAADVKWYVRRAEKKLRRRLEHAVAALRAGDPEADDLLHRARKAAKRHRYAVEATVPLWGPKADRIVADRKELQDVLGSHQDTHVTAGFLRDLGARVGSRSGHNGFTYGLLYAREIASGQTLLKLLKPHLR